MQGFDCRQGQKLDSFAEHPRLASTPDNPLLAKLALPSCDSLFTGPALAPLRELSSVNSILKGSFFLGSRWKQGHSRGQRCPNTEHKLSFGKGCMIHHHRPRDLFFKPISRRSEEHPSDLQSLLCILHAVF